MGEKEQASAPFALPDSSQKLRQFSRPGFLRLVSNLVDTFSIERNVALGIFTPSVLLSGG